MAKRFFYDLWPDSGGSQYADSLSEEQPCLLGKPQKRVKTHKLCIIEVQADIYAVCTLVVCEEWEKHHNFTPAVGVFPYFFPYENEINEN